MLFIITEHSSAALAEGARYPWFTRVSLEAGVEADTSPQVARHTPPGCGIAREIRDFTRARHAPRALLGRSSARAERCVPITGAGRPG